VIKLPQCGFDAIQSPTMGSAKLKILAASRDQVDIAMEKPVFKIVELL
jgi:hypothetical protein